MLLAARGRARRQITLVISSNQASLYNAFTAAGSPAEACDVTLTLNTGVLCQIGITTGSGWATGTTFRFVNDGQSFGPGGAGGAGDSVPANNSTTGASPGASGGPAFEMHLPVTINNLNGFLRGGGGGGGGGGMASRTGVPFHNPSTGGGGGGGGGRGYNGAAGGAGGSAFTGQFGDPGLSGSSGAAGAGDAGGGSPLTDLCSAGTGGNGGDWGQAGSPGANGQSFSGGATGLGGNGGAAGPAVKTNGHAVTWEAGNNGTQVVGPIT